MDGEPAVSLISSVPAGNYTIKLEDSNNCVKEKIVTLSDPEGMFCRTINPVLSYLMHYKIQIELVVKDEVDTIAGTFSITAEGGTKPYSFKVNIKNQDNTKR